MDPAAPAGEGRRAAPPRDPPRARQSRAPPPRETQCLLRPHRNRPEDVNPVLQAARAAAVGVEVAPPFVSPSDGLAARWAGLPTIFLSSASNDGGYPDYHRPGDVPGKVDVETVVAARRLCTELVAELDRREAG